MDIKGINKVIDDLKDNLGDALLACDISSFKAGASVANYNMSTKTAALVNRFSKYLLDIMTKIEIGDEINYYAAQVKGGFMMYVIIANDYCCAIMVDGNQVANGMMMVGVLPDAIAAFQKATK